MFGFSCLSFSGNSRFGYTRLVSLFDLTKLTDSIHYFLDKSSSKKNEILFFPKSFIFFLHTLVRVILVAETFPQNCGPSRGEKYDWRCWRTSLHSKNIGDCREAPAPFRSVGLNSDCKVDLVTCGGSHTVYLRGQARRRFAFSFRPEA